MESCGSCKRRGEVEPPLGYAVVDFETTSRYPTDARVVSVAIVVYDCDGEERERHHALVNPGVHIPERVTEINGLDDEAVKDAPPFRRLARPMLSYLAGYVFCAHNAEYDLTVLQRELFDLSLSYEPPGVICTKELARFLEPKAEKHTLESCCELFAIARAEAHEALADALACGAILRHALVLGWAPETLAYDDKAFKRLRSVGDTSPATEGQLRRVWGLAKERRDLRDAEGKLDRDAVLDLVERVSGRRDVDGLSKEEVQLVFDALEAPPAPVA